MPVIVVVGGKRRAFGKTVTLIGGHREFFFPLEGGFPGHCGRGGEAVTQAGQVVPGSVHVDEMDINGRNGKEHRNMFARKEVEHRFGFKPAQKHDGCAFGESPVEYVVLPETVKKRQEQQ